MESEHIEQTAKEIVDAAMAIHKNLGPGLLESVYETILFRELRKRGLRVVSQKPVTIEYEEVIFHDAFRADLLVEDCIIVELKSVERTQPVHFKQVLTYLRLMDLKIGFLLNFGTAFMRDGIFRIANRYVETELQE
ncbi:GxxExxY protein [Leptospira selangorensis]|uniref:GxxExxY protein n=1 Tax=Leptospira selangorensis TaxID=2484982 RepID=A0A5F2BXQ5_9LEPT|nr:GxxExxY protein [Leptospira selangorensis]TGM12164.1 GxxExxY protein [Leptospira selangorensis]TGM14793.1 GxxExxY protein [Leptospira selangorensis]